MAKAVLISIRPEWVEKILTGKKTLEVRKTRPKLETPFKCYIYCTNSGVSAGMWGKHGKVVGEFVCDKIDIIQRRGIPENFDYCYLSLNEWGNDDIETEIRDIRESCIPKEKLNAYAGKTPVLYAWHISELKIYEKPRVISEFTPNCRFLIDDGECQYREVLCDRQRIDYNPDGSPNVVLCERRLQRPPNSWCYVEELE